MKKLLSLIFLTLFFSNTAFSEDVIFEYNEKLSNKELSTNEIIEICNEYKSKNIDIGQYDQATFNTGRGIENYCTTMNMRAEFKSDAKYDLVKDLNIEKIKFNLLSNKYFSVSLPETKITKNSACHMDIKNESNLTYLEIFNRCGVAIEDEQFAKDNWISIIDYFYADANKDDYMDLIIRFKEDGSYSTRPETMTAVITSLSKDNFININYESVVNSFDIGNEVYLNACTPNPDKYYDKPLNIQNILVEVPNKIIKLEKSKYDRAFQTLATSAIDVDNNKIDISVSNFRDLIIKNSVGDVLVKRLISGASSIYELKHKGKVVAWGVGWHKQCGEFYPTDFTALRVFVPVEKNNKITIDQQVISLNLTQTYKATSNSDNLILAHAEEIWGSSRASTYYYEGIQFFEIDNKNGFKPIIEYQDLNNKIEIDKLNPAKIITTLSKYNEFELLQKYTKENFDEIYSDLINNYWWDFYFEWDDYPNVSENYKKLLMDNNVMHSATTPISNEEISNIKKICFSKENYKDITELVRNCYYWYSSLVLEVTKIDFYKSFENEYENKKNTKPSLGIRINQPKIDGVRVESRYGDSAAYLAGIEIGDIIISYNSKPVKKINDLLNLLSKSKVGDFVDLQIIRDGKKVYVKIKLGAK